MGSIRSTRTASSRTPTYQSPPSSHGRYVVVDSSLACACARYVSEYVKRFEAPRSEQHRPPSPVPVPAYVAPVEVEPLSFPQPVAPPLPPRQQTQQATMGYDPYAGYQQQAPPPYGYGLAPPVGYYAPPAYHPQPPVHQQAPQGQGVNLVSIPQSHARLQHAVISRNTSLCVLQYDHRKPKGGIGRRLVEKTYLWGKN
jgi:hypothetical protein